MERDEQRSFLDDLKEQLMAAGLDIEKLCCEPAIGALKLVCVPSSLRTSVEEMSTAPRDQVVMVRVDEQTVDSLDNWVETGAVKSRSEAAAVFIREGLKVRSQELQELKDALADVEAAKARLREKARQVLDKQDDDEGGPVGDREVE